MNYLKSEQMSETLAESLLAAAFALEAVLFAVFGIFYQVYATYSVAAVGARAPICNRLRLFCRLIAFWTAPNAAIAIVCLWWTLPASGLGWLIGLSVAGTAVTIVIMTYLLAFIWME
jgi:hypothetical protein